MKDFWTVVFAWYKSSGAMTVQQTYSVVYSSVKCRREEMELVEKRFRFIRSVIPESKVMSEYVSLAFAAEDDYVTAHLVERVVSRGNALTSGETLMEFLIAIRQIESMGICLSKRCGDGENYFLHWAHDWLLPASAHRNKVVPVVNILPQRLVCLVPSDLHSVTYSRDIIGFLALTQHPRSIEQNDPRPATSRLRSVASLKDALSLLRELKVSDSQRANVYERILGSDSSGYEESASDDSLDKCFLWRFSEIVFQGKSCGVQAKSLALRFYNRVVLHDFDEAMFKLLRLMDRPLAERITVEQVEPLWQSVMACTLKDSDLKRLWDIALISSPELLVRVVVFGLIDVRDLVVDCSDAILTMGDLVDDFNSIIALANEG